MHRTQIARIHSDFGLEFGKNLSYSKKSEYKYLISRMYPVANL